MNQPLEDAPHKPHPLFDPTQDLAPNNEVEAAQIREIALNGVENLQRSAIKMQDNTAEMGRWILASLLAMNTGGAIAIVSASDQIVGPPGPSIICFGVGATLAIATGINGMVAALRLGPVIGDVTERLRLSVFESTIHAATRQRALDLAPILRQHIVASAILAAGSLASFGVGIWAAVT